MSNHDTDYQKFTDEMLETSLSQVEKELSELSKQKKRIVETFVARKHDELEALLAAKDEPYGTVHVGNFEVAYGKKVSYDQEKLAVIAKEIADAGEKVSDYIKIEYDISESKFKAWPEPIKAQFIPARTVARGNPTVKVKGEKE
jgi:hypothetical protein